MEKVLFLCLIKCYFMIAYCCDFSPLFTHSQAAESHIQNFGQTPSQLLNTPHPCRYGLEACWRPLINNVSMSTRNVKFGFGAAVSHIQLQMSHAVRLRCHTPSQSQQFGKKGSSGFVASIYVDGDSIIAIYSDLMVGFMKWSPKTSPKRLHPDRLKALQSRELSRSVSVLKRGSAISSAISEPPIGNWTFKVTVGGEAIAKRKRRTLAPSRLASAKESLSTELSPLIVSCGYFDNTIKVHSAHGCKVVCVEHRGHRGKITSLAMGTDGGYLVTGGEDCTCRVWTVDYPDMAAALADGYVQTAFGGRTKDDEILSCCHVLWGHETPVCSVDLSSELDVVASGSTGGKICLHLLRTGKFIRSFRPSELPDISVRKIVLERHGRMVVQTSDLQMSTFTVNGACLCTVDAGERVQDMKITGEVVISGGDTGHVYIRNLSTLKVLSGLDLSRHGPVRSLCLTPDDLNPVPQYLFIGSDDGMISIVEND
jgi:WD40 repeat protein